MLYYLIPTLIALVLSFFDIKGVNKNKLIVLFLLCTAFILCGGYMTGSDWRNYELLYESASLGNIMLYGHEKGFYIYMCLFRLLGFNFFLFLTLSKALVFYSIFSFIKRYSQNSFLGFFLFLTMVGIGALFLFVDNPLRFMLAFGIITLSYKYLLNRSSVKFLLLVILASTFHLSALLMIIVYFLSKKMPSVLFLGVTFALAYFIITPNFIEIVSEDYFPIIYEKIGEYIELMKKVNHSYFSIGKIFYVVLFYLILSCRSVIEKIENGELYFSLSMWFFLLFLFSNVIPTFHRLMIYVLPFLLFSLIIILENSKNKVLFTIIFIPFFLLSMIKGLYSSWTYLPYTNYFAYMLKKEVTYEERSNYNIKAFEQRTGKKIDLKKE